MDPRLSRERLPAHSKVQCAPQKKSDTTAVFPCGHPLGAREPCMEVTPQPSVPPDSAGTQLLMSQRPRDWPSRAAASRPGPGRARPEGRPPRAPRAPRPRAPCLPVGLRALRAAGGWRCGLRRGLPVLGNHETAGERLSSRAAQSIYPRAGSRGRPQLILTPRRDVATPAPRPRSPRGRGRGKERSYDPWKTKSFKGKKNFWKSKQLRDFAPSRGAVGLSTPAARRFLRAGGWWATPANYQPQTLPAASSPALGAWSLNVTSS